MTISTTDARALFTKKLIAVYKERTTPTAFLRSFFTVVESNTKQISIEVQRGTEKIAVDVARGTEGRRNSFSKSSEKIFVPPYYREYFDATELDFYDRLFTEVGTVDEITFAQWLTSVTDKVVMLQEKIERSYELQCKQVLTTGIVILTNGTNIDFKRKAASLVDLGAGNYWTTGTNNPYNDLEAAGTFLRTTGKSSGNIFNVIMGQTAIQAFMDNPFVKARADIRRIALDSVRQPQREATGGVLHGEVSAGAYVCRLWSYPEFYDTDTTVNNDYLDNKKIIVLPESPRFVLAFAAVPRLMGKTPDVGAGLSGQRGAFLVGEYLDDRNSSHVIDIKSAGVAVPVGVDQVYTAKVIL